MIAQYASNIILAQDALEVTEMPEMGGGSPFGGLIGLVIMIFLIAAIWKIFTKAGKPGWAAIIPFYNIIVLLEVVGRPIWWIILALIPIVNIVIGIILAIDLAKSFAKGGGFAVGLILLPFIFYPILGFGSAQYQGPAAAGNA